MIPRKYIFIGSLMSFIFLSPIVASDEESTSYPYEASEYPNIIKMPKACTGPFRLPPTSVCDPENILNKTEAKHIDYLIEQNKNGTYCFCPPCEPNTGGLNIKVAVVETIKLNPNQTYKENLEYFANYLQKAWNVSQNCTNDVIILIVTAYSKIQIARGAKAQRVLSSSSISNIQEEGIKSLKYGKLSNSLKKMLEIINKETHSFNPQLDRLGLYNPHLTTILISLAVLIVIVGFIYYLLKKESKSSKNKVFDSKGVNEMLNKNIQ